MPVTVLSLIEVIVSIILIVLVLLQPKGAGLSVALTGNTGVATERRGPAKTLHNLTVVFGVIFVLNSLALFWIA